jgi:hypothetical protein
MADKAAVGDAPGLMWTTKYSGDILRVRKRSWLRGSLALLEFAVLKALRDREVNDIRSCEKRSSVDYGLQWL